MIIEVYVCGYLNGNSGIPAFGEVPEQTPKRFFVVEKLGSGEENLIGSAIIAVQSFAPSKLEAAVLNEQVKELMKHITERPEISKCKLNSDYDHTDTKSKRYRYQAVFDIVHF